jgi:hypothetical protein
LPRCVKDFLVVHETYHATDKDMGWIRRELKANWAGFKEYPVGFFVTMIMSLTPSRLKMYYQRWKNKK